MGVSQTQSYKNVKKSSDTRVTLTNRFRVAVRLFSNRELKHATFLSHGRQPEVNISHARTVVFLRFSK